MVWNHNTLFLNNFSLNQANGISTPESWDSQSQQSEASTTRFPALQLSPPSHYLSSDSLYSTENLSHSNTGSLESLLVSEDSRYKQSLRCSKYSEIGNPHARKRGKRKQGAGGTKKWHKHASYAKHSFSEELLQKEKLNFMDKQSGIYNSYEKAKIEHLLTPRKRPKVPKIKAGPILSLGELPAIEDPTSIWEKNSSSFSFNPAIR